MKRSAKALATGAAIAAGPRGLRRLLAAVLLTGLALVLGITVLSVIGKSAGTRDEALPCAPHVTAVQLTPDNTPQSVQKTVMEALITSGRSPEVIDYGDGERSDLVVSWWPTRDPSTPSLKGRTLRLEAEPTVEEVTAALGTKLAACENAEATSESEAASPSTPGVVGRTSKWSSPITWIGSAVALWWAGGPWIVRVVGRAIQRPLPRGTTVSEPQPGRAPKK